MDTWWFVHHGRRHPSASLSYLRPLINYVMPAETGSFVITGIPVAFQTANYPTPLWVNESVPGGTWQAGQASLTCGASMFDGLEVYAGQLGTVSAWDLETEPAADDPADPIWIHEAFPGGTWYAGQPSLTAGAALFDGLTVYAGQLGEASPLGSTAARTASM